MKLQTLLKDVKCAAIHADVQTEIQTITADSRQVCPGSLFVCLKGRHTDGHACAAEAIGRGAAAVVVERDLGLPGQILVPDTRQAYAALLAAFHGHPERRLRLIGVTGTNGKTTVTATILHLLRTAGYRVGLIGTVRNEVGERPVGARMTTPDPKELYALLAENAAVGCDFVVMECSSQALDQGRLCGLRFERAVFTNLTRDHLDYHDSMAAYRAAKRTLFDQCEMAVLNLDDPVGRALRRELDCPVFGCSAESDRADFTARDIRYEPEGVRFVLVGEGLIQRIHYPMPGDFSVLNALEAAACCHSLGVGLAVIAAGLQSFDGVTGRMEVLPTDGDYRLICDYAHTPDGLEKVLQTYCEQAKGRLVVLFGCGGDRDAEKRPKMGAVAAKYADLIVLTSDNPRGEAPLRIIADILAGVVGQRVPCQVIPDRREAIKWVLYNWQKDDIILLAGKGHEKTQTAGGRTVRFDEREIVAEILKEKLRG